MKELPKNMAVNCPHCSKPCPPFNSYCSFECRVETYKKEGGVLHQPNGLPITCFKYDGNMYEHEHGDHPDYKYPVTVMYKGDITDDMRHDYNLFTRKEGSDDEIRSFSSETHALIYKDNAIAITLYECCYAMWYLKDGSLGGGSLWGIDNWQLDLSNPRLLGRGRCQH